MQKIILHLCADTGSDSKPYRDAGYDVRLIGKEIGVENYIPPQGVHGIIANPVCTDLSFAKMKWRQPGDTEKGLFLFRHCIRIIRLCQNETDSLKFYVIENPASSSLWKAIGNPTTAVYEPWHYGSPWTKKTALFGKFNMPERRYSKWEDVPKIEGLYTRPNRKKPSLTFMHKSHKQYIREFDCFDVKDDMSFRSLCSQNFAKAFFEVNQ